MKRCVEFLSGALAPLFSGLVLAPAVLLAAAPVTDYSDPGQVQPYIESLKKKNGIPDRPRLAAPEAPKEQAQKIEERPSSDPREVQPYIESLREKNGLGPSNASTSSSASAPVQPYIESLKKGKELEPKYRKTVRNAAGFNVVASNRFDIASDKVQANSFNSVYTPDEKYAIGANLFYERQLYRDRYAGAIGPFVDLNVISLKGHGIFTRRQEQSQDTFFRFFAFPVTVGGTYRFTQFHFVCPFIQLGAVGIPFLETRDDDHPSRKGISRGVNITGGAAFSLDWIGRKNAWDEYDSYGILHTYLTVQMEYLRTIAGSVRFNYTGLYAGLMFEF